MRKKRLEACELQIEGATGMMEIPVATYSVEACSTYVGTCALANGEDIFGAYG